MQDDDPFILGVREEIDEGLTGYIGSPMEFSESEGSMIDLMGEIPFFLDSFHKIEDDLKTEQHPGNICEDADPFPSSAGPTNCNDDLNTPRNTDILYELFVRHNDSYNTMEEFPRDQKPFVYIAEANNYLTCAHNSIKVDPNVKANNLLGTPVAMGETCKEPIDEFLEGLHVTQQLRVVEGKEASVIGLGELLARNDLEDVTLKFLPVNSTHISRFIGSKVENKRSIAKFSSYLKLLAVENHFSTLEQSEDYKRLKQKEKNNKFSQCQRDDKGTGDKIVAQFMELTQAECTDTLETLALKSRRRLIIVNSQGYIKEVTGNNDKPLMIYDPADCVYLVRNVNAFCKTKKKPSQ